MTFRTEPEPPWVFRVGLILAAGVRHVVRSDPATGEFTEFDGPDGLTTWEEAEGASKFLPQDGGRRERETA